MRRRIQHPFIRRPLRRDLLQELLLRDDALVDQELRQRVGLSKARN